MNRMLSIFFALVLLVILLAPAMVAVQAGPTVQASTASDVPPIQYWRMGFNLQPKPFYADTVGRMASIVAEMRSDRADQAYFAFPAAAGMRFVREAYFYIMNRNGSYSGMATMQLGIYDYAGNLQHVISAGSLDLQAATPQVWIKLALVQPYEERRLEPGEFLAVNFALDGATGGDLDMHTLFEVAVGPISIYLPVIRR